MSSDAHDQALIAQAEAWAADDPDPATRAEVAGLVARRDLDALREQFAGPLEFGTAGMRGIIGAGPARMNEATVSRAAAGIARQLLADVPGAAERGVVVGRDARRLSLELARCAAEVLVGHGLRVHWFPAASPTPLVAFAGRHLDAAGTAILTASHNPPQYNGLKVYSARGSQIVPPQDRRIRQQMDAAGPVLQLPRVAFEEAVADGRIVELGEDMGVAYLDALDRERLGPVPPAADVRAVTTALHGVGHVWVERALARRGFEDLHPVLEQAEPDGEFPTVDFPNPEEPGALDLALAKAREVSADLVVANDPDTDRLCVAVRSDADESGYQVLSGNEIGALFGDWLLGERARTGSLPQGPFVATTIVSTTLLERIARHYGADYEETLTGFKWIWDKSIEREAAGATFIFGFEEALGYCVSPLVRDKDGVSAAQTVMEMAASLKARGRTLLDRLDDLARRHGVHLSRQVAVMLPGLDGKARIEAVMKALREESPTEIGGGVVVRSRDLAGPDAEAAALPRSNVLTWWLEDGSRIVVRPSGTEPKLKTYFELREVVAEDEPVSAARQRVETRMAAMEAWIRGILGN